MSTRPRSSASATSSSASSAASAIGFSTKTCFPAASARRASSTCVGTGVATTTASTASSCEEIVEAGRRPGRRVRAAAATARRSSSVADPGEPASSAKLRARFDPPSQPAARSGRRGSQLPYVPVHAPVRARGVAEVDDELSAIGQVVVVDSLVRRHDHDAVGRLAAARRARPRTEPVLGELRDVRVV